MINIEEFRQLALSFPETSEQQHFEKTSFRAGKKIFATCNAINDQACIKLSEIDQSIFTSFDQSIFFAVPNKWGKSGWTLVNLKRVRKSMFTDALTRAYCEVTPKKLSSLIKKTGKADW